MSFMKMLAIGMFFVGCAISIVAWNGGERGFQVFVWPLALGGGLMVFAVFFDLLFPEGLKKPEPYKFPQSNEALPPSGPTIAEDLGPELFLCRPLPLMEYTKNQGSMFVLVLMPLLILPALAAIAAVMVPAALIITNTLLGHSEIALKQSWWWHPLINSGFIVAYATGLWFLYLVPIFGPIRDHLIVHAHGFKLKCSKMDVGIRFKDLLEINFGRELKNVPDGAPRKVARDGMFFLNSAMNLQLKSGRTVAIKCFLRRFDPQDTERFLDYVEDHYPALFLERAYLTDAAGGPEFVITESRWKARQPDVPHPRAAPEQPLEQLADILPDPSKRSPLGFSPKANPLAATIAACAVILFSLYFLGAAVDGIDSGTTWVGSKSGKNTRLVDRDDDPIEFWIAIVFNLVLGGAAGYAGVVELRYRLKRIPTPKTIPSKTEPSLEGECPKCHADVQTHENLRCCVYCGSDQLDAASPSAPAHCRACGSYLKIIGKPEGHFPGHINFCGHCGFKLTS